MENVKILRYDGSLNGFLCAIYRAFESKLRVIDIQKSEKAQKGLFTEVETIITDVNKARRVWIGIQKKNNAAIKNIYFSFLSESKGIELLLYKYICSLYNTTSDTESEEELQTIRIKLYQYSGMVSREKLRIESIAKFRVSQDGIYFSAVSPYYDVLPLLSKYYRSKFPNKAFAIYDLKRRYAVFYDLETTQIIRTDLSNIQSIGPLSKTNLKPLIKRELFTHDYTPHATSFFSEKEAV
ncbi:TIGR03915 family putative DNA repair protein [Arenibacter latericius]|uniref:TIGR03915 family putative DNA repair protein n=1 Tax=Arenibacter latericius TaxID=86104 RepID=UPI000416E4CF|nr:TIGR03915 family putative DNA repair protein [Arenibacter latericius]MDX1362630.1 TIGR03915 family putative DNA repair protein [Arenibacter latericius]